jgi:F-type H+-transporting ATPase subunit delta
VRQGIRGYTDGLIALAGSGDRTGRASVATLASELSGVRDVISGSDDLRRALGDPGVLVAARRGLIDDIFGAHVGATTLAVLGFVLDADRASETVADVEWLAERLAAASRNMEPVGDVVLGTKAAEERAEGFTTAILQAVEGERNLANLEDELFRFSRVVAGSDELSAALASRDVAVRARKQLVTDLLQGKATEETVLLATYVTQIGRPRDFQRLLDSVVARVAAESNRRLAEVRSAVEMDEQQQQRLAGALGRVIGHDVDVRVTVDPSLLGGFVATIGDTVVDGSARHQLDLLKERLVMPEASVTTGQNTTEEHR